MDMMSYLLGKKAGGGAKGLKVQVVEELPATGEEDILYLVPKEGSIGDVFDEYIYVNENFEKIGSTDIDLSDYQKTIQYTTMPIASVDTVGKIVQYTGATNANYTNGYFYIGTTDGAEEPVYSWENINVQDGGGDSSVYDLILTYSNRNTNETLSKLNELFNKYKNGESVKICFRDNYTNDSGENRIVELPLYFEQYVNFGLWNLNSPAILDTTALESDVGYRLFALNIQLRIVNNRITGYQYWYNNSYFVGDSTGIEKTILTTKNTTNYTPTGDYNPATKKYVDDLLKNYTGYDAEKTQVLKNINGTFTWVDEA